MQDTTQSVCSKIAEDAGRLEGTMLALQCEMAGVLKAHTMYPSLYTTELLLNYIEKWNSNMIRTLDSVK